MWTKYQTNQLIKVNYLKVSFRVDDRWNVVYFSNSPRYLPQYGVAWCWFTGSMTSSCLISWMTSGSWAASRWYCSWGYRWLVWSGKPRWGDTHCTLQTCSPDPAHSSPDPAHSSPDPAHSSPLQGYTSSAAINHRRISPQWSTIKQPQTQTI